MAGTSKANLRQTSANVAATLTAAFAAAGIVKSQDEALSLFKNTRDEVFTDLEKQPTDTPYSGGGGGSYRKSGGGGYAKGGNSGGDPGSVVMNYGKFKGLTIAQVYALDKTEAANYGYERSGRDYIAWLTKNDNNKFLKDKATAFVESKRSSAPDPEPAPQAEATEDWS